MSQTYIAALLDFAKIAVSRCIIMDIVNKAKNDWRDGRHR